MTIVDEALDAALEDPDGLVALVGPSGVGKSHAALRLAAAARERGLTAIRVAPPAGGLDAGAAAMASVVSQLGGRLQADQGWRGALETAARRLQQRSNVLVVCDEPSRWDNGGRHFAARARDAAELLVGPSASWPAVTVERATTAADRVIELPRPGVPLCSTSSAGRASSMLRGAWRPAMSRRRSTRRLRSDWQLRSRRGLRTGPCRPR